MEPDLSSQEAIALAKEIPSREIYGILTFLPIFSTFRSPFFSESVKEALHSRLSQCTPPSWDELDMGALLHEVNDTLDVKPKVFMTSLRHALTGFKVYFF